MNENENEKKKRKMVKYQCTECSVIYGVTKLKKKKWADDELAEILAKYELERLPEEFATNGRSACPDCKTVCLVVADEFYQLPEPDPLFAQIHQTERYCCLRCGYHPKKDELLSINTPETKSLMAAAAKLRGFPTNIPPAGACPKCKNPAYTFEAIRLGSMMEAPADTSKYPTGRNKKGYLDLEAVMGVDGCRNIAEHLRRIDSLADESRVGDVRFRMSEVVGSKSLYDLEFELSDKLIPQTKMDIVDTGLNGCLSMLCRIGLAVRTFLSEINPRTKSGNAVYAFCPDVLRGYQEKLLYPGGLFEQEQHEIDELNRELTRQEGALREMEEHRNLLQQKLRVKLHFHFHGAMAATAK